MTISSTYDKHIKTVNNFQDLVSFTYKDEINAVCWNRELIGDFSEIVSHFTDDENIIEISEKELLVLQLTEQGQLAREIILNDLKLLSEHGASPNLNVITCYENDDDNPFFPTDVYSFHVDRSPIGVDTFLCTYHGASSEIIPNSQVIQKILVPEIRAEIKKLYKGKDSDFDTFLSDHFLDLHYQLKPNAIPISLGNGHIWRLAIDHPQLQVPPCIHRAPKEKSGEKRLLLIC